MKIRWGYIAASTAVAGLIFWGGNTMLDMAMDQAGTPVPTPDVTTVAPPPAEPVSALPPCATEDSDDCIWDATIQGNGEGRSFIRWHDETYYLTGQDFVTVNGETFEGHYSTIDDGQAYVLYCEAPLAVGIDTDADGNEWAACM